MHITKKYKALFMFAVGLFVPVSLFIVAQLPAKAAFPPPLPYDSNMSIEVGYDVIESTIDIMATQLVRAGNTSFAYDSTGVLDATLEENYPGDTCVFGVGFCPMGFQYGGWGADLDQYKSNGYYAILRNTIIPVGQELIQMGIVSPNLLNSITYETYTWTEHIKAMDGFGGLIEGAMLDYAADSEAVKALKESGSISVEEAEAVIDDIVVPSVVEEIVLKAFLDQLFFNAQPSDIATLNGVIQEHFLSEENATVSLVPEDPSDPFGPQVPNTIRTAVGPSTLLPGLNDFYGRRELDDPTCDPFVGGCTYHWVPWDGFGKAGNFESERITHFLVFFNFGNIEHVGAYDPYPGWCQKNDTYTVPPLFSRRVVSGCNININPQPCPPYSNYQAGDTMICNDLYAYKSSLVTTHSNSYALTDTLLYHHPTTQVVDIEAAMSEYFTSFIVTAEGQAFIQNIKNLLLNELLQDPEVLLVDLNHSIVSDSLTGEITNIVDDLLALPSYDTFLEDTVTSVIDESVSDTIDSILTNTDVSSALNGVGVDVIPAEIDSITADAIASIFSNTATIDGVISDVSTQIDTTTIIDQVMTSGPITQLSIATTEEFLNLATTYYETNPTISALLQQNANPVTLQNALLAEIDQATAKLLMTDAIESVLTDGTNASTLLLDNVTAAVEEALIAQTADATNLVVGAIFENVATTDELNITSSIETAIEGELGSSALTALINATATNIYAFVGVGSILTVLGADSFDDIPASLMDKLNILDANKELASLADTLGVSDIQGLEALAETIIANDVSDITGMVAVADQIGIASVADLNVAINAINTVSTIENIQDLSSAADLAAQMDVIDVTGFVGMVDTINSVTAIENISDVAGLTALATELGVTTPVALTDMLVAIESVTAIENISSIEGLTELANTIGVSTPTELNTMLAAMETVTAIQNVQDLQGAAALANQLNVVDASQLSTMIGAIDTVTAIQNVQDLQGAAALANQLNVVDASQLSTMIGAIDTVTAIQNVQDLQGAAALANQLNVVDASQLSTMIGAIDTVTAIQNVQDLQGAAALANQLNVVDASQLSTMIGAIDTVTAIQNVQDLQGAAALANQLNVVDASQLSTMISTLDTLGTIQDIDDLQGVADLANELNLTNVAALQPVIGVIGTATAISQIDDIQGVADLANDLGIADVSGLTNLYTQFDNFDVNDPSTYSSLVNELGLTSLTEYTDLLATIDTLNYQDPEALVSLVSDLGIADLSGMLSLDSDISSALGIPGGSLLSGLLTGELTMEAATDAVKEKAEEYATQFIADYLGVDITSLTSLLDIGQILTGLQVTVDSYLATDWSTIEDAISQTVMTFLNAGGPFGGPVQSMTPCDCSKGTVFSVGLGPRPTVPGMDIWANPGKSKIYPYGTIAPGNWVLGTWELAVPGGCWKKEKFGCSSVNYYGVVDVMGTSLVP